MDTLDVTVTLPRSILATAGVREEGLDRLLRETLAVELYRMRRVSLGKAAEIACLNRWEMLSLLAKHDVPLNYTADDAARDWDAIEEVLAQ